MLQQSLIYSRRQLREIPWCSLMEICPLQVHRQSQSPSFTRTLASTAYKRRRKIKQDIKDTSAPTPVLTVREKRLKLIRENVQPKKSNPQQINQLLSTAQGRVSWLRDRLYSHWNPDYLASQKFIVGDSSIPRRPKANAIRMDARWWFWNVLFAVLPATLIVIYCEFYGKYYVYDFHRQRDLADMKRLLGDDFAAKHADELLSQPPENVLSRLKRVWHELNLLLSRHFDHDDKGSDVTELMHESAASGNQQQDQVQQPKSRLGNGRKSNSGPTSVTAPTRKLVSDKDKVIPTVPSKNVSTPPTRTDISADALLKRIQRLEEQLQQHQQQQNFPRQESSIETADVIRDLEYQMERSQQSNIQNRMEDEKIALWKKRLGEKGVTKHSSSKSLVEPTLPQEGEEEKPSSIQPRNDGGEKVHATHTSQGNNTLTRVKEFLWKWVGVSAPPLGESDNEEPQLSPDN
ncbi:hypothetical protein MPSEU_000240100 [Mayamaea pseudoterrestris]|nr:hypothetical protein MPSEU_000240100 [Mayamaea pseudoterrestris]